MKKGQCLKCNSKQVFFKKDGIVFGDGIYILTTLGQTPSEVITYICASCGYFENYIKDKNILKNISRTWNKL